ALIPEAPERPVAAVVEVRNVDRRGNRGTPPLMAPQVRDVLLFVFRITAGRVVDVVVRKPRRGAPPRHVPKNRAVYGIGSRFHADADQSAGRVPDARIEGGGVDLDFLYQVAWRGECGRAPRHYRRPIYRRLAGIARTVHDVVGRLSQIHR